MRPLLLAVALAACHPAPRSAEHFARHPEETAKVVVACERGDLRGKECVHAREGRSTIEREARMELYRRSFR